MAAVAEYAAPMEGCTFGQLTTVCTAAHPHVVLLGVPAAGISVSRLH